MKLPNIAAIDFGLSNIDAVAMTANGQLTWSRRSNGKASVTLVKDILCDRQLTTDNLQMLATTGGRHRDLPDKIDQCRVVKVNEVAAIGRGGQALVDMNPTANTPILVVSAGSGTAAILANGNQYQHAGGTAVGGGTLQGLGRLLLETTDPLEINHLALLGNSSGADLTLAEVISGPIGHLPPDATAVNFGRLAKKADRVAREDLAAALVTMISQVIALVSLNIARAVEAQKIVLIGHLCDMPAIREAIFAVGDLYQAQFTIPESCGYGTALGALKVASG